VMVRRNKLIVAASVVGLSFLVIFHEYRRVGERRDRVPVSSSSSPGEGGPCFDFHQASSHAGENGCVSGFVLRAFTSKAGTTFLDFCTDYKKCPFSSVIFASDRNKFGDLETLVGRQVEIHGLISTYNGRPEIIIHNPRQIQAEP
jgi:hypothetical protein